MSTPSESSRDKSTAAAATVSASGTAPPSAAPPLPLQLNVRLSLMMFLQYAIWGSWLTILLPYLLYQNFTGDQIGNIFAVGAVGAIVAPFIAGQIADRYIPTQWFLGASHLVGAALMWQLASVKGYSQFLWFSLAYSIVYSPTLSLTNSLAFHHLPDRDRDFGRVRVWGTVGWIIAGIAIGQWLMYRHTPAEARSAARQATVEIDQIKASLTDETLVEASGLIAAEARLAAAKESMETAWDSGRADAFKLSAILGAIMGIYCFFLPHTPPQKGAQAFATGEARSEVQRNARLMALFLFSLAVSCIHQFYFVHAANFLTDYQAGAQAFVEKINFVFGVGGGGLMTIGQISELAVLAAMPLLAKRLSRKTLLTIGIVAYAARMALFAFVEPIAAQTGISPILVLMAGVALHGVCFGCFIFVAFMIVDEELSPDVRASGQSLYNVVIIGFGIIVGSKIATGVADWAKHGSDQVNYTDLFSVPLWAALLTLVAFLFLYPSAKKPLSAR